MPFVPPASFATSFAAFPGVTYRSGVPARAAVGDVWTYEVGTYQAGGNQWPVWGWVVVTGPVATPPLTTTYFTTAVTAITEALTGADVTYRGGIGLPLAPDTVSAIATTHQDQFGRWGAARIGHYLYRNAGYLGSVI